MLHPSLRKKMGGVKLNCTPLKHPQRGQQVRFRTGGLIYSPIHYGRICDLTPDGRWVKVKPNHPHYRRRWLPVEWIWEVVTA